MKIKFIAIACLILGFVQPSTITGSFKYLPIMDYQKSLMAFLCNFSGSCFYPSQTETIHQPVNETSHQPVNEISHKPIDIVKEIQEMSREEALETMKLITTKIFDASDPELVGAHLLAMRDLAEFLDQEADKKTITAIHFLLANQHRSSAMDTAFWWGAINKYELSTAIPMTPEVAKNTSNVSILRKKMAAQKIKNSPIKKTPVEILIEA